MPARPLYNEGEEISALDNDVDKWLDGGLDVSMPPCGIRRVSILWEPLQVDFLGQKLWHIDLQQCKPRTIR